MALAPGDYLQISIEGTVLSQPFANVFHVQIGAESAPIGYGTVITWANALVNLLKPFTSSQVVFTSIRILNLTNSLDFVEQPLVGSTGAASGDCMPAFVAYGYKLNRSTLATDPGSKRFPGVAESLVVNGTITGAILPQINAVADYIGSVQEVDGGVGDGTIVVYPMIYGAALPERTTKKGTVLPPRPEVFNPVSSAQYLRITSQNTRKP